MVIRFFAFFFPFRENSSFSRLVCLKRLYTGYRERDEGDEGDAGRGGEEKRGREDREGVGKIEGSEKGSVNRKGE